MADIELVIRIPEEHYNDICNSQTASNYSVLEALDGIRNGISLPKGHGDLIDKGIFKKWIETQDGDTIMTEYYIDALDAQETIIEAEKEES